MKGHLASAVAIVLALGHAGSAFAASTATDTATTANRIDPRYQFFRQQLANAHAMARDNNFANADRVLSQVIGDPLFSSLSGSDQRTALSTAGWMAVKLDEPARASDLYRRATAYDDADPDDWYRLSLLEFDQERYEASSTAFVELAERWPQLLPNVDESHIHRLLHKLPSDSTARVALAQALFDANWTSKSGADSMVWYQLAVARVDRGDGSALAAIRRIDSPSALILLRSDKRFDSLVDANSWTFNVENAVRKQVEELQRQADLAPTDLDIRTQLSYALLMAGMHDEAIALADRTLAAIANAPADEPAFSDIGDQVWQMNNRAIALRRLGRTEEALAELIRASQLSEAGEVNVSQALNLGVFYCSLGRPDDALQAIAPVGRMSGYGRMVQNGVLHCAALQKGDKRSASRALAYLRKHHADGPMAYLEALLRAGKLDEAAGFVSGQLASPDDRGDMLEWLQDGRRPAALPGDAQARAARDTLLARQDVLEAVAKVGRIERYGIYLINTVD